MLSCSPVITQAATVISTNDKQFEGELIASGINTVTINDVNGGYTIVPRKDILAVEVDVRGGERLSGLFHDWNDGVFVLKVGDRLIGVQDGLVTSIMSAVPSPALPSGGPKAEIPNTPPQAEISGAPQEEATPEQPSPLENLGPAHRIQM